MGGGGNDAADCCEGNADVGTTGELAVEEYDAVGVIDIYPI